MLKAMDGRTYKHWDKCKKPSSGSYWISENLHKALRMEHIRKDEESDTKVE